MLANETTQEKEQSDVEKGVFPVMLGAMQSTRDPGWHFEGSSPIWEASA